MEPHSLTVGPSKPCLSRSIAQRRRLPLQVVSAATTTTVQLSSSAPMALGHSTRRGPMLWGAAPPTAASKRTRMPAQPLHAIPDVIPLLAESPYRDAVCCAVCIMGATALVKVFDLLATTGVIDKKLSRKLVHTTSGPLFLLTWPLFSANPTAKFLAAIVPLLNFTRLLLVGSGVVEDKGLVLSVSRGGERSELLKGPLYYCIVLIGVAVLCWRDSPSGLIAISLMCGGDGLADIIGRRFGTVKLPYNTAKSWAGSMAMFFGGVAMSLGLIYYFCNLGFFSCYGPACLLPYVLGISLVATLAESLPINQVLDDNISVPVVALVMSMALMTYLKPAM